MQLRALSAYLGIAICSRLLACSLADSFPPTRTTPDRLRDWGYSYERHKITTKDGYILKIFRILDVNKTSNERPAVLLMHGLSSSSDCWLIGQPDDVLALNLLHSGYDVWLGNSRGNSYGLQHKSLSDKDPKFWRYSFHEIAVIDLPTTIDYILEKTNWTRLHYIGHSQGTTVILILLSSRPKYNDKLISTHLLAPVAFMNHVSSVVFPLLASVYGDYSPLDSLLGDMSTLDQPLVRNLLALEECRLPQANPHHCAGILFTLSGGSSIYLNYSMLPDIFASQPASCSFHQIIHYIQLFKSKKFRQYDFGKAGNLQRYHSSVPPDYKLQQISTPLPLHLYYSGYDEFSSKNNVEQLSKILGKNAERHFIPLRHFAHIDFLWAHIAKEAVYRDLMTIMKKADRIIEKL